MSDIPQRWRVRTHAYVLATSVEEANAKGREALGVEPTEAHQMEDNWLAGLGLIIIALVVGLIFAFGVGVLLGMVDNYLSHGTVR